MMEKIHAKTTVAITQMNLFVPAYFVLAYMVVGICVIAIFSGTLFMCTCSVLGIHVYFLILM